MSSPRTKQFFEPLGKLHPYLFLFFLIFLGVPLFSMIQGGFYFQQKWTLDFLIIALSNPFYQKCFINSLSIAVLTTGITLLITFPFAWIFEKFDFFGKKVLFVLLLVPLFYPPFVSAGALKQFFAPYGTLNLTLSQFFPFVAQNPIDWLGSQSWSGVILVSILHAIPLMLLALRSTLSKIDPTLLQASQNLGASSWVHFSRVIFPLAFPGVFAGCTLVFIGAFTDLGAPLMFEFQATLPTQIYNLVSQPNQPMGYLLVTATLSLIILLFWIAQKKIHFLKTDFSNPKLSFHAPPQPLSQKSFWSLFVFLFPLILLLSLPLLMTLFFSFSQTWFMSPLPTEWSVTPWKEAFTDPLIQSSFLNSLLYSSGACVMNIILGLLIATSLARGTFRGKNILQTLVLLPMALPGIVLAFAYYVTWSDAPHPALASFWKQWIDPRESPHFLMILSYGIHRITFMVYLLMAGYASLSITLEHAAQNLGASRMKTFFKITIPLLGASLKAGILLVFVFSMLEVSSGMILAQESPFYPLSKAIYSVLNRIPADSFSIASALGILTITGAALILWIANSQKSRS